MAEKENNGVISINFFCLFQGDIGKRVFAFVTAATRKTENKRMNAVFE